MYVLDISNSLESSKEPFLSFHESFVYFVTFNHNKHLRHNLFQFLYFDINFYDKCFITCNYMVIKAKLSYARFNLFMRILKKLVSYIFFFIHQKQYLSLFTVYKNWGLFGNNLILCN